MMNYSSDIRIGFAEGIWMIGVIDEVRMPLTENDHHNPILIDTKTRARDTLPAEPQRRNGRYDLFFCHLFHSVDVELRANAFV